MAYCSAYGILHTMFWASITMQLSTVMIWVCSTLEATAMQRWVWDSQTGVGPQASQHEKDSACKVVMDASATSGFCAPHLLVLLGCVSSLQSISAGAPQRTGVKEQREQ